MVCSYSNKSKSHSFCYTFKCVTCFAPYFRSLTPTSLSFPAEEGNPNIFAASSILHCLYSRIFYDGFLPHVVFCIEIVKFHFGSSTCSESFCVPGSLWLCILIPSQISLNLTEFKWHTARFCLLNCLFFIGF